MKFHTPYHTGKACYRLALRPPMDPINQSISNFSLFVQERKHSWTGQKDP